MTKFQIVNSPSQVPPLLPGWTNMAPNNNLVVVDKDGNQPTLKYHGILYQVVAKKERTYSCPVKCLRVFLGVLATIATLSIAWFCSQTVRDLVCKRKEEIRYAIPLSQTHSQSAVLPSNQQQQSGVVSGATQSSTSKPGTLPPSSTAQLSGSQSGIPQQSQTVLKPSPDASSKVQTAAVSAGLTVPTIQPQPYSITKLSSTSLPLSDLLSQQDPIHDQIGWDHEGMQYLDFPLQDLAAGKLPTGKSTQKYIQKTLARMDLWDQKIQLRARLLANPSVKVTLRDLLRSWEGSCLNYALPMGTQEVADCELGTFKLKTDLQVDLKLIHTVWVPLVNQCRQGASKKPITISSESQLAGLKITEIGDLDLYTLNAYLHKLPSFSLCFINPDLIPQINLKLLSPNQLEALLLSLDRFSPEQLVHCIAQNTLPKEALSSAGILRLDFSKVDSFSFRKLFPVSDDRNEMMRIRGILQQFNAQQILECLPFFERDHWDLLSEKQVVGLDYSKMKLSKDLVQEQIFPNLMKKINSRTVKMNLGTREDRRVFNALHQRDPQIIDRLLPYLESNQLSILVGLNILTKERILQLDSTLLKNCFEDIFPVGVPFTTKFFSTLTADETADLSGSFTWNHWKLLSDSQRNSLDYAKVHVTSNMCTAFFGKDDKAPELYRLAHVRKEQINYLAPYFSALHWGRLSNEQCTWIDWSKLIPENGHCRLSSDIFKAIFDRHNNLNVIRALTSAQLARVYRIMHTSHWQKLTPQQLLDFPFTEDFFKECSRDLFRVIFPVNQQLVVELVRRLDSLAIIEAGVTKGWVPPAIPYFQDFHWKALTNKQLLDLPLTTFQEGTLPQFVQEKLKKLREEAAAKTDKPAATS